MSIIIKGLNMPKSGEKIIILTSSGYVEDVSGQVIQGVEAVELPPHGRAIDADVLKSWHEDGYVSLADIREAPTIIEAEC